MRITRTWCQIVSFRESVLCSHVTSWFRKARAESKQEQNLLNYIRSQFVRFWTLYIDVCSRKQFARSMSNILLYDSQVFRFAFFSISQSFFIFLISLTHFLNLLQSNHIDIESMRSQSEMRDLRYLWDVDHIIQNQVVNRQSIWLSLLRQTQTKDTWVIVYFLFNSRYQIAHRCFILWRVIFRTLHSSDIRSITRSHVLQSDLTSYLKSMNHRISIRSFLQSSHRCMI